MNFSVTAVSILKTIRNGRYLTEKIALKGIDIFGFEMVDHQIRNVASMNGVGNYGELTIHIQPMQGRFSEDRAAFSIEIQQLNDQTHSFGRITLGEEEFSKIQEDVLGLGEKYSALHISASAIADKLVAHSPIKIVQELEIKTIEFVLK